MNNEPSHFIQSKKSLMKYLGLTRLVKATYIAIEINFCPRFVGSSEFSSICYDIFQ